MLKRYFISNIIIMLFVNILVKPIWVFLIDRNVQLQVGHKEYGMYSALVSLTIMFNILLDMGITSMNNRNLASNTHDIESSLPNMMAAKLVLSLVYTSIIFLLGFMLGYQGRELLLLLLLAGVQMLNSFMQYLRSNVSANHDFKIDSLLSVLDKVLMIAMCGFLLVSPTTRHHFKLEWFIYTQLLSYGIAILVALVVIVRRYSGLYVEQISLQSILSLCKQSLPYALLILLMGVYMRSDSIMLERMEGPVQNSLYAATYRILDIANMSGFLFAGILLPMFSRLLSRNHDVRELVVSSTNILVSISLALVAFSLMYSQEIMQMLYTKDANQLALLYKFTIGSFPAFCLMYVFSTLLTANGNISLLVKIAGLGGLLSLILNYILISKFQAIGAAAASLIVEWILAFIYIFYCKQQIQLTFTWKWVIKFPTIFISILAFNAVLHPIVSSTILVSVLNLIFFLVLVYTIKLWDRESILNYMNQFKSNG